MENTVHSPLATVLAARLRGARTELTARWLERIAARVNVDPNRIFPTDELLDHVPLLLDGVAEYLESPAQTVAADVTVVAHARELGALRHEQGFDLFQILKEYELLGGILLTHLSAVADETTEPCTRGDLLGCGQRVFEAVALIQQATATEYMRRMQDKLAEREERLRQFNRTLTHELRNGLGAARGAAQLLLLPDLPASKQAELAGVVERSTGEMQTVLEGLLELSRVAGDARQQRHVRLREAAQEAVRRLREKARAADVTVRLAPELPDCEVHAAAVELCLTNLISNAIKYADPTRYPRWVEISGRLAVGGEEGEREVIIEVRDNGRGVPAAERGRLFQRFFRGQGHTEAAIDGTGLGLSIVRETVEDLGGRVWADFPADGSVFGFSLPCRRGVERRAADRARAAAQVS